VMAMKRLPVAAAPIAAPVPEAKPLPVRKSVKSAAKARAKPVEPVIPLVHAPDDPGPDSAALESDPVPEPTSPPPQAPWQRFMQLFR